MRQSQPRQPRRLEPFRHQILRDLHLAKTLLNEHSLVKEANDPHLFAQIRSELEALLALLNKPHR